jgi:hypothetical protein
MQQIASGSFLYSASDVVHFLECEHLTSLDLRAFTEDLQKTKDDEQAILMYEIACITQFHVTTIGDSLFQPITDTPSKRRHFSPADAQSDALTDLQKNESFLAPEEEILRAPLNRRRDTPLLTFLSTLTTRLKCPSQK